MKPTDEMVSRATLELRKPRYAGSSPGECARQALTAALADYEPAPFELSEDARRAMQKVYGLRDYAAHSPGQASENVGLSRAIDLCAELERYQRVLVPKLEVQLTVAERRALDRAAARVTLNSEDVACIEDMLARFPKAAPGTVAKVPPKPVQGPFALSEREKHSMELWRAGETTGVLVEALERAVRTLAAPAVEPLTLQEERLVQDFEGLTMAEQGNGFSLLPILRKRFPKPEPARKTAKELRRLLALSHAWSDDEMEVIEELVRRAEENEKS